jgi:integrase
MNRKGRVTTTSGIDWTTMHGLTSRLLQDGLYRDYLLVYGGSYFGLRISDLLSLRWEDVLDRKELILTEQKTHKRRKISINPKVSEALKMCKGKLQNREIYGYQGYIFCNRWGGKLSVSYINKRLKYIFRRYQVIVQNPSSHTLRKTFGKRVWDADGQSDRALVYLSEIFSHSSVAMTRRYIGITEKQIADVYLSL